MARLNNPLISTIIPVYKVEGYLRQTIDSVITQDIGFLPNVELILINDGSPDRSDLICRDYQKKYPNNIIYIEQKNAGVSAARNTAMKQATGQYIHFFDSDDLIQKNAYSEAISFLNQHENDIDFVALRLEFFDARIGGHPLNYKFTKDRVIDVDQEPDALILHLPTCIIKRASVTHLFDTDIKISEDMKFLSELLQQKKKYGIIDGATYFYRKRRLGTSAIDGSRADKTFYTVTPKRVYEELLGDWTIDGRVHLYAQHVVMYDLQWRLMQDSQTVLSTDEEYLYKKLIRSLIRRIDDEVILAQRYAGVAYLRYALEVKYGRKIPRVIYEKLESRARSDNPTVIINFIRRKGDELELEGYVENNALHRKVTATVSGRGISLRRVENVYAEQSFLGDLVDSRGTFKMNVAIEGKIEAINFKLEGGHGPLPIIFRRFSRLSEARSSYTVCDNIFLVNRGNELGVMPYSKFRHLVLEMRWLSRILVALKLRESVQKLRAMGRSNAKRTISKRDMLHPFMLPIVTGLRNIGTVLYRLSYYSTKPLLSRREVWIVSDRATAAGDNGEALHEYVYGQKNPNIRLYFAISKESRDYSRMKKKGRVLNSDGLWYRIVFLHASKIISSHADDHVINPFSFRLQHINDLYSFDFIFLQHGVIHNKDISVWLNRFNKNIRLFVTSAESEYRSILRHKYYYTKDEVLLSGLPRYDKLEDESRNKLILAPTWRHWLAGKLDARGVRLYNPKFKETEYFEFYNSILSHQTLAEVMRKKGIVGEFYLHPSLIAQATDFDQNDVFAVKDFPYDYRTAFKEGSLLITDYSSVLFDFIYLNKPIIYTQFDVDKFNKGHTIYKKGDMDDAKDGFGPVVRTIDQAIDAIITLIESDYVMEDLYQKRIDTFFAWHDKNNSKRVYDAILGVDGKDR